MKNSNNGLILVTGGAGFIGYHLTKKLLQNNYEVRVFDNLYRANQSAIEELKSMKGVEFIEGDVRYLDQLNKAMCGVDYVFHQAAVCINKSLAAPSESSEINFTGSMNVFDACVENNVKKLIFASSASVYGEPRKLPMSEDDKLFPITPYCISKAAVENLADFYSKNHNLKYVGLRYFNVYGPRQPVDAFYTNVVVMFVKRILNGEAPIIKGTGDQSMDFIHVDDIIESNLAALMSDVENEIFNVGSQISTTIKDLAYLLLKAMGREDLDPVFSGDESMVSQRQADISKIKSMLNWEPKITAEMGLSEVGKDIMKFPEKY